MKKRKGKIRKRHMQAMRGKKLAFIALTASVLYLGVMLYFTLAGERWGSGLSPRHVVASLITGFAFIIGSLLAVYAYLGHPIFRQLYLALNVIGGMLGIIWVGSRLAQGMDTRWLLFDLAGIAIALFVCWIFFVAKAGQAFLQEQEFNVKRI